MRKKGLGRGLSELISGEALARTRSVLEVHLDKLEPNPYQPRQTMDEASLEELTLSIEAHGIVQPVVVRRTEEPEVYQIIAGERRWRAAQRAGLQTIPCVVHEADEERMLEIALVENLQRDDLGPLETAQAMRHLIQQFGLTQEQIAEQLGRSRSAVANLLRLLDLPAPIKQALAEGRITQGHARALLSLQAEPERMMELFHLIEEEELNVRDTERLTRDVPEPTQEEEPEEEQQTGPPPPLQSDDPHIEEIKRRLRDRLGTKVTVLPRAKGGGTINITYHDMEDLDRILSVISPTGPQGFSRPF
ncbi:MAG: ParB/RepB/Spo0J family partition protein [candidate division WS1 bacterium]|jgi:ParB family chromosome partitioning protein|nr:ParB/RepB/Spo0J family partition protein [candidate division WS1 bacterium]